MALSTAHTSANAADPEKHERQVNQAALQAGMWTQVSTCRSRDPSGPWPSHVLDRLANASVSVSESRVLVLVLVSDS